MKLFIAAACLVGLGKAADSINVEVGGEWGKDVCESADRWTHAELGVQDKIVNLEETTEDVEKAYVLKSNIISIKEDSKKRKMMGIVTCWNDKTKLGELQVTGKPVFKNLPNALTNLNQDKNKRIECEAIGYPIPTVSWRFQAIEDEMYPEICPEIGSTSCKIKLCRDDCDFEKKCGLDQSCKSEDEPKCTDDKNQCVDHQYATNSTLLFDILTEETFKNINVRYANISGDGCPMDDSATDPAMCQRVNNLEEVQNLAQSFQPKSQLLFSLLEYSQGGKYICVADQTIDGKKITKTKPFVWLVKDPMAALWPFLALVAEVIIVVCIILYYERASQKGESAEDVEEGDEFIETKKEDS